jgi:transposase-like protein
MRRFETGKPSSRRHWLKIYGDAEAARRAVAAFAAAKAFFESAKMVTGITPDRVTTDGHGGYPRAMRTTLGAGVRHRDNQYLNN